MYVSAPIPTDSPRNPCSPSPCGANAVCKERNGAGSCTCLPDYHGDPYVICRPECVTNGDCDGSKSCLNNKCVDPCPGTCGLNAECLVFNHAPRCSCLPRYTGNPSKTCLLIEESKTSEITNQFLYLYVTFPQHQNFHKIHVNLHLVDHIVSVEMSTLWRYALAL